MKPQWDAKKILAVGSVITALLTGSTGLVQGFWARSENAKLLRQLKREAIVTRAYMAVVKERLGIKIELSEDTLRELLDQAGAESSWSMVPVAMADESKAFQFMIGNCTCICPPLPEADEAAPPAVAEPAPPPEAQVRADAAAFKKGLRDAVKAMPKTVDDVK